MSLVNYFMTNEDKNGILWVANAAALCPARSSCLPVHRRMTISRKSAKQRRDFDSVISLCARDGRLDLTNKSKVTYLLPKKRTSINEDSTQSAVSDY